MLGAQVAQVARAIRRAAARSRPHPGSARRRWPRPRSGETRRGTAPARCSPEVAEGRVEHARATSDRSRTGTSPCSPSARRCRTTGRGTTRYAMMYWRPVAYRASLIAASTASVPEFVRKLRAVALERRDAVELLAHVGVDRQVEVARRVVEQLRGLALDGLDDLRDGSARWRSPRCPRSDRGTGSRRRPRPRSPRRGAGRADTRAAARGS